MVFESRSTSGPLASTFSYCVNVAARLGFNFGCFLSRCPESSVANASRPQVAPVTHEDQHLQLVSLWLCLQRVFFTTIFPWSAIFFFAFLFATLQLHNSSHNLSCDCLVVRGVPPDPRISMLETICRRSRDIKKNIEWHPQH